MSDIRIDLGTARTGQGEFYTMSGKTVRVVQASSITAIAYVSYKQDNQSDYYPLINQALLRDGQGFEGVYIRNEAQPGQWLIINISNEKEDFEYETPTSNNINEIARPVKVNGGGTSVTGSITVTTAGVKVRDANANRTSWSFHNNGANTIFIGGPGVTVATGFPILPGEKWGEDSTEELWAIVSAGTEELRFRVVNV